MKLLMIHSCNLESDDTISSTSTTILVVSIREDDKLACLSPNYVGISQSAGDMIEVETCMARPHSSGAFVPSEEELKLL
jgi:hypothetical protein